jgi:hypothetical protein
MTESNPTLSTNPPRRRRSMSRSTPFLALGVVALFVAAIWFAANRASDDTDPGLVFVIPAGASGSVAIPGIDSAIVIPTDIRFGPGDVAKITVRNDDTVVNRAGPWVIEPGQTYSARFDQPGTYEFECAVDAAESVTVTVTDEDSPGE